MQFSSIKPIDMTLSRATTPGQSGPGRNGNEGGLRIPQSPSITGTSPSDSLVWYPAHSLVGCLTPQQKSSRCILLGNVLDLRSKFAISLLQLYEFEKGKTRAYNTCELSLRDIVKKLKRHHSSVDEFSKKLKKKKKKKMAII